MLSIAGAVLSMVGAAVWGVVSACLFCRRPAIPASLSRFFIARPRPPASRVMPPAFFFPPPPPFLDDGALVSAPVSTDIAFLAVHCCVLRRPGIEGAPGIDGRLA